MRLGLFLILILVFLAAVGFPPPPLDPPPERALLLGLPAWGPSWLEKEGRRIPAGCGPEAARLLLWYWDVRLGTNLVRNDPEGALVKLHSGMGTVTVVWEGTEQGLTWPWKFAQGLESYARTTWPAARVRSLSAPLDEVFARAVELLAEGNPPVLLFDWEGRGGLLPNHYALVVGYDRRTKELVVNPGWGYPFQSVPFTDPRIGPVQLFWLEGMNAPWEETVPAVEECPAVRAYEKGDEFIPWCEAHRALLLGPGLLLLLWD